MKKDKLGGFVLLAFKAHYKATVTKTVQTVVRRKERHLGPRDRMESAEVNAYIYGQLIFHKGVETIQWAVQSFQQMVLAQQGIHMHNSEVGPLTHTTHTQN